MNKHWNNIFVFVFVWLWHLFPKMSKIFIWVLQYITFYPDLFVNILIRQENTKIICSSEIWPSLTDLSNGTTRSMISSKNESRCKSNHTNQRRSNFIAADIFIYSCLIKKFINKWPHRIKNLCSTHKYFWHWCHNQTKTKTKMCCFNVCSCLHNFLVFVFGIIILVFNIEFVQTPRRNLRHQMTKLDFYRSKLNFTSPIVGKPRRKQYFSS